MSLILEPLISIAYTIAAPQIVPGERSRGHCCGDWLDRSMLYADMRQSL